MQIVVYKYYMICTSLLLISSLFINLSTSASVLLSLTTVSIVAIKTIYHPALFDPCIMIQLSNDNTFQ